MVAVNLKNISVLAAALVAGALPVTAQGIGLKTNVLYWATTTPNVGLEAQTGRRHTAQLFYGLNPWRFSGDKLLRHWVLQPEYRYWFCQTFNGWFVGAHAMGGQFDAGGIKLPFGLLKDFRDKRYEGWFVGGGVTAGYQLPLSRHWNMETSIGVGYDYLHYSSYECGTCGNRTGTDHRNYVGPTKAALELVYMF